MRDGNCRNVDIYFVISKRQKLTMNTLADPIFKGCTRPAMLWGIPMVPALVVGGGMLIPAIWALLASPPIGVGIVILIVPVFVVMRSIARHDDQRLAQLGLLFRMRVRQRNRGFWGAHSYMPMRPTRRK
jgi:type IV secretion system protein VirB3